MFGWIYFKRQLRLSSLVNGVGLGAIRKKATAVKARRSNLRIFSPPSGPKSAKPSPSTEESVSDQQVDTILAKITEHGEESLTDREREVLAEASRKYRSNK